jgi:RNA-directed DNA polymerase
MSNWTPHSYITKAGELGYPDDFVQPLVNEGNRLVAANVPVVFTLRHLAAICDVPFSFLHDTVGRKIDPYREFKLRKKSGGYRQIVVPHPPLLIVQRWIHQNILRATAAHNCATAYMPGRTPYLNASQHRAAKWLVKTDIQRFFESVSERQVFYVFREIGYRPLLSFELARLCTRTKTISQRYRNERWRSKKIYSIHDYASFEIGHLPQGAPTSPILANLVCYEMDEDLRVLAQHFKCTYTRYADDIAFSTVQLTRNEGLQLIRRTSAVLSSNGFKRNVQKTHIVPPGARKVVTGLLVSGQEPRLLRKYKETISLHLYHAKSKGIPQHCTWRKFDSLLGFREHLKGLIAYAEHVEPAFGHKCRTEFNALPWGVLGL